MINKKVVLTILIGTIALGSASATLAWYGASNRLVIESVEISIDADRELKISNQKDDLDQFVAGLDDNDFAKVGAFVPVSSMYKSAWIDAKATRPKFYDASHYSINNDGAPFEWEATFGYFCQDIYILSDDDVYVTLDSDKSYIEFDSESFNNAYASGIYDTDTYTKEEIVAGLIKLPEAMRFSFLISDDDFYSYSIIDPNNKNEDVYLGGVLDNNNATRGYYDYYQNGDELKEIVYGEITNRNNLVYDAPRESDSGYQDESKEPNAFNARHKKGVSAFNFEASKSNIAKENAINLEELKTNPEKFHFPVYKDTPRKVTVAIYIEGWDIESVNYTMGSHFKSNISFKIDRDLTYGEEI